MVKENLVTDMGRDRSCAVPELRQPAIGQAVGQAGRQSPDPRDMRIRGPGQREASRVGSPRSNPTPSAAAAFREADR
jgi:hypothetical protein